MSRFNGEDLELDADELRALADALDAIKALAELKDRTFGSIEFDAQTKHETGPRVRVFISTEGARFTRGDEP